MIDNVFVPSFGNKPKNLVGREAILNRLYNGINSVPGSREKAQLILGQRGLGKTVLLLMLAEEARKQGMIVASPTVVSGNMIDRIIEKLNDEGGKFIDKKSKISGGNVSVLGFGAGIQVSEETSFPKSSEQRLVELCRLFNSKGHSVLLLVDEVQANQESLKQLIVTYQELVGEGADISLVMAGLPGSVSAVLNDHVLTFLNRASKLELEPLNLNDINIYYRKVFKELGIELTDKMIDDATSMTGGSPYLMQLIGHYITIAANDKGKLDKTDYQKSLDNALDDYKNDICQTSIAPLSDRDIEFLTAMAEDENESEISEIAERLGCTSSFAQTYKRRLLQAGLIEQHRRGKVRFAVPYLAEYINSGKI